MQMLLNSAFRQIEFGMIAGFPSFSCLPTQTTNDGISAMATASIAMFGGCVIVEVLDVIIANTYESKAIQTLMRNTCMILVSHDQE